MNAYPPPDGFQQGRVPAVAASSDREIGDQRSGVLTTWSPGVDVEESQGGARRFLKYLNLVLKYKVVISLAISISVFGAFVVTFLMTPIYAGTTTIQIDRDAAKVVRTQNVDVEDMNDPKFYQTQYELLKSRSLAERVAATLKLADSADFRSDATSSAWTALLGVFLGGRSGEGADRAADLRERQRLAVTELLKRLSIRPIPLSRLVNITFSSSSPQWAQLVSIAVAENFIGATMDRRFGSSSYARTFLEERLQQLKLKLEESEKQVVAYAQKEGIVNVDDKQPQASSSLASINKSLGDATSERVKTEQLWRQAQIGDGLGLPQVLSDKNVQAAREKRTSLMADYKDKQSYLKPAFPEMIQLKAQIRELDQQIATQVEFVKQAIRAQFEAARNQEASFEKKLAQIKADVLDLRSRSIEYNILLREVDTNRALYDGLLQQYKEVGVAGAVNTNNVSIIDRAEFPKTPVSPSLLLNLSIGLMLGLISAAGLVTVLEIRDDTFKSPEDIEEGLGFAVLGVTPLLERGAVFQKVLKEPTSGIAEAYRSLRTALQFSTADGVPRTLLVTSTQMEEGKSTAAACLAVNFAQLGMRVFLIDADLRKPSLHLVLGVDNSVGLSNYLVGADEPSHFVQEGILKNVTFMSSGPLPPNPAELLAGAKLASLIATANERFDLVIVDSPPVVALADAPMLGSIMAGTLLVVEAGGSRRGAVRAAVKRLYFARARINGVLLNKFDMKKSGFSYGYGGADYYGYGVQKAVAGQGEQNAVGQLREQ